MSSSKILYVCEQIAPYLPVNPVSQHCRSMLQSMQERGCEIRTFMPRYGVINERRNQLHEVIRLSGMNIIINDNDHQLIIKVASIPAARVQIYFIDNDDYFSRKATLRKADTQEWFDDNGDRAVFFARGVLETIRKLRWQPNIVHCHGWFSSIVPLYLRNSFADDPLFRDVRIVVSLYDDAFEGNLSDDFASTLASEGVDGKKLEIISPPSYQNMMKLVIDYADGIILENGNSQAQLGEQLAAAGKKVLVRQSDDEEIYMDNYKQFYDELL